MFNKKTHNKIIMSYYNEEKSLVFFNSDDLPHNISIPNTIVDVKKKLEDYKLYTGGSKIKIMNRLFLIKRLTYFALKIQSFCRLHIYKTYIRCKGPALYDRNICTNVTDFSTFDKLTDIKQYNFFSYRDLQGFVYGFDMESFFSLCLKGVGDGDKYYSYIFNPYNRSVISENIMVNFSSMIKIYKLLYGSSYYYKNEYIRNITLIFKDFNHADNISQLLYNDETLNIQNTPFEMYPSITNYIMEMMIHLNIRHENASETTVNNNQSLLQNIQFDGVSQSTNYTDDDDIILLEEEFEISEVQDRINYIFDNIKKITDMEVKPEWFMDFSKHQLIIFIYHLQDIWRYRANISNENRNDICPNDEDIFSNLALIYPLYPINNIRMEIINILDKLVNDGVHEYAKFTGSIFVIGTMTMISEPTRNEYNWLYLSFC
jgi:uncharacterized protein YkuJ